MDKTLFRRLFNFSGSPALETTEAMAERGNAEAQFKLGLRYASAQGAAQDYSQAAHWYLKAADQSHSLAQFNLGIMYANGQGMPRDNAKSVMWISRAADLGDAAAQYNLGVMHHRDSRKGVTDMNAESRIEAYKWFHLAAAQGYKGSMVASEMVNLEMSHKDLTEGRRRVEAFLSLRPPLPESAANETAN